MFFNCCRRSCRCRQNNEQEKDCWNKCDRHDKCNERDDKYDKCDHDKKEKCCCHINYAKPSCWDNDNRDDKFDNYPSQYSRFEGQGYYCEYNHLGYFNQQDNRCCEEDKPCKNYTKQDNCLIFL